MLHEKRSGGQLRFLYKKIVHENWRMRAGSRCLEIGREKENVSDNCVAK